MVCIIWSVFLCVSVQTSWAAYQTIIFDLGGVIREEVPRHISHMPYPYIAHAMRISPAWREWMKGNIYSSELIYRLSQEFDLQSVIDVVTYTLSHDRAYIPETVNLIHQLYSAGYDLYLLSNLSWDAYYVYVHNDPILAYFTGILCSCQVGYLKPDPAIYQSILQYYNLDPKTCIFIDDKLTNVQSAQLFGMYAIVYDRSTLKSQLTNIIPELNRYQSSHHIRKK